MNLRRMKMKAYYYGRAIDSLRAYESEADKAGESSLRKFYSEKIFTLEKKEKTILDKIKFLTE